MEFLILAIVGWLIWRWLKTRGARHGREADSRPSNRAHTFEAHTTVKRDERVPRFEFGEPMYDDDPDDRPDIGGTWKDYYDRPITEPMRFEIEYVDGDGVVTERVIRPTRLKLKPKEYQAAMIVAFCELRQEERDFYSPRITKTRNLGTGRSISNLGSYLRNRVPVKQAT